MKKSIPLCVLVLFSLRITAQVSLVINSSRTSGVAPLYVFFDGVDSQGLEGTNDLSNADFSWNFDTEDTDPVGRWEVTKGMVVGHVFESPGTYRVSCTLTGPDGTTDTQTVNITVEEFSGTTYYISEDGNDNNDGLTEETPLLTIEAAQALVSPNVRILFRRGDRFEVGQELDVADQDGGPIILGAYGDGEDPILHGTRNTISILRANHVVIIDLHLVAEGAGTSCLRIDESAHILGLRLEMEGATTQAVRGDGADEYGIFDSYLHDFGVLGIFTDDGTRFSWVGNTMDQLIGTPQEEHGMRVQRGEKQFIAHNVLSNLIDTKSAIQIRGDNQRYVMLYRNTMDRILGVNPTNAAAIQAIYHVTIEGNYVGQNAAYVGSLREPDNNGINIEANRITLRNNVIDGYTNAINVGSDRVEVISEHVDIFNNTVNWREVSPQSNPNGKVARVSSANGTVHPATVRVINNLMTVAQDAPMPEIIPNEEVIASNNFIVIGESYFVDPLPNSDAATNRAANYRIVETSSARESGTNEVPVYFDLFGNPRPSDSNMDVGAFQFGSEDIDGNNGGDDGTPLSASLTEASIRIFPNPITNHQDLTVDYGENTPFNVRLLTVSGKVLIKKVYQIGSVVLSTDFLAPGIYLLETNGKLGIRINKVLIK